MEPIAIIGIGCRFPGAADPAAFWRLLTSGGDAIAEVPKARWDIDRFYDPDPDRPGHMTTRWGGFVEGLDRFDAAFFRISPREAAAMDPQQRLVLEVAWQAIEDAGLTGPQLARSPSGVFLGISNYDHGRRRAGLDQIDIHSGVGSALSIAANRVSYVLDLRGPSLAVDTACSSSLLAVHLACQSLRAGDCNLALAGGVNALLGPEATIAFSRARMMAGDGRCKTFDARADGYVRGEGAGIVVLKALARAEAAGDEIVAVIRGSAVNQDGASNGLTAPNPKAQEAVIRQACKAAGVSPGRLQYVEAHGTGTPLGDPIEVKALGRALARDRTRDAPCALGSVKTNIGHLESAAGIAGLIKVALALQQQQIPPSLHFHKPNPHIDFAQLPLVVQDRLAPWPTGEGPALAGVSSFGFGGSNAHVVLEAALARPPRPRSETRRSHHILPLSAKDAATLNRLAGRYRDFIDQTPQLAIADLCASAAIHRSAFNHRLAVTGASLDELRAGLAAFAEDRPAPQIRHAVAAGRSRPLAFAFTGQGAQYFGMGGGLYESEPLVRKVLDRCDAVLRRDFDLPLLEVMFGDEGQAGRLERTASAQPALFALGCAIAELLASRGIRPEVVIGHSLGEYTAACVAGAFDLEAGLTLVAERGRLMQALPVAGAMAAVLASEAEVRALLGEDLAPLSLAALNGPRSTTLSGPEAALAEAARRLKDAGLQVRPLAVSHAFHSALMEPMLDDLAAAAEARATQPLKVPLISNLDGCRFEVGSRISPEHWRRHTRAPVAFAAGLAKLAEQGPLLCLEIGPQPLLCRLAQATPTAAQQHWIASLRRDGDDRAAVQGALAELYVNGLDIDWRRYHRGEAWRRLRLPTYPFEGQSFPLISEEPVTMIEHCEPAVTGAPIRAEQAPAQREDILARLREVAAKLLWTDVAGVDPNASLMEVGADSVVLMEFLTKVEAEFAVKLPLNRLYDDLSTLAAVAGFIAEARPAEPTAEVSLPAPVAAASREGSLEHLLVRQLDSLSEIVRQQVRLLDAARVVPATVDGGAAEPAGAVVAKPPARSDPLTPGQRHHLESLAQAYNKRTRRSKRYAECYRAVLADRRATAGFRPSIKELLYPIVGKKAKGARFWDIDGNEYLDLAMGFGTQLFGHYPPFLKRALSRQIGSGLQLGPQAEKAGAVAAAIAEMTGSERVLFCNSGTEAVMTALRLARAASGRARIAMFAGAYHGHFDATLALPSGGGPAPRSAPLAPGIAQHFVDDTLVLPYGAKQSLELLRAQASGLAAILVEPVQSRNPDLQPGSFLAQLREIADASGAALIFDEIITGFRVAPGGAQEWFGVTADLATYGKLLGGGLPIGVVAGKAAYLDAIDGGDWRFGDDSAPGVIPTFFAGTFNKNPLTLAAAQAVLAELRRQGPELQSRLNERTDRLVDELNDLFVGEHLPIHVAHFGSLFRFEFKGNLDAFYYHLLNQGLYLWEGRTCFLSTAHEDADLRRIVDAAEVAVGKLRGGGFLPPGAQPPRPRSLAPPSPAPAELTVRLAEGPADIERAQALRYRVFYEEMGARPSAETARLRRDCDGFDAFCDHVLVCERASGEIVGTYRLRRAQGQAVGDLYSAKEFDLSALFCDGRRLLELGRACVAADYRRAPVLPLLWQGIHDYVAGCCRGVVLSLP
jgi:acyl transferase domain-containing protein